MEILSPAGTSVAAFVTTLHCAVMLLRKYRPRGGWAVLIPSFLFIPMPWLLTSPLWMAAGFAAHVAYYIACELLLAPPLPAISPRPSASSPAAAATPPAAAPRPRKAFELPVLAVLEQTPEIRTFRLARPADLRYKPGQFLMVRAEIGGRALARCYSINTAPSTAGYVEISVRKQGIVSGFLHESVTEGTVLSVSGPGGGFVYPEGDRPLVLIAGGIGITPLLGMLRHALDTDPLRPVTLLLSARTEAAIPFLEDLRLLARRHPRFTLGVAITGGTASPDLHSGRIDAAMLGRLVSSLQASVFMLCGPLPMIDDIRALLESLGVPAGNIHFEKFETAVAAASAAAERKAARADVRFERSGRSCEAAPAQSILEAAEAAGITSISSMCRVGVCGTCRTRLISGEVDGDFDAIDASEQAAGWILPCVALPRGPCAVEA